MSQSLTSCLGRLHPAGIRAFGEIFPQNTCQRDRKSLFKPCGCEWRRGYILAHLLRPPRSLFTFNFHVLYPILTPRWPRCNNLPQTATYTCCNLLSVPEPKPLPPPLFTKQNNKVTQIEGDTGGMNQRLRAGARQKTLPAPKLEIRRCAGCKSDLYDFEQEDYDGATVLVSTSLP